MDNFNKFIYVLAVVLIGFSILTMMKIRRLENDLRTQIQNQEARTEMVAEKDREIADLRIRLHQCDLNHEEETLNASVNP